MKGIRRKLGMVLAFVLLTQEILGCVTVSGTELTGESFQFLSVQKTRKDGTWQQSDAENAQEIVTDLTDRGGDR